MKIIAKDFRLAFSSIGFLQAVIITALAGVAGGWNFFKDLQQDLTNQGPNFLLVAYDLFYSDLFVYVLSIVAPLAYATSFVDEYKTRTWIYVLTRSGSFRKYKFTKIITTAFSGGTSVTVGMMISTLVFFIMSNDSMIQYPDQIVLGYLVHLLLLFIGGCIWALFGGFFATVMNNQYVAYASPFIMFYVGSVFQKRYYKDLPWLSPREWTFPLRMTLYQTIPIAVVVLIVSMIFYYLIMTRRMRNG